MKPIQDMDGMRCFFGDDLQVRFPHVTADKLQLRREGLSELVEESQQGLFRFDVLLFTRWCLLKRPENLTERQGIKLADLLRYNLKAVRSYLLKEDFQFFWAYKSPNWAGQFMDAWCRRTMRSRIEPMKKVARMLRSHRDLMLNWFRAKKQISAGTVEGFNNKAKLTTRKAYGFRTFKATEVALYHTLGALPEPPVTHRFS